MHKIGFIGGGKIAQAMAKGFIKAGRLFKLNMKILHNIGNGLHLCVKYCTAYFVFVTFILCECLIRFCSHFYCKNEINSFGYTLLRPLHERKRERK